jgi:hypothetical protein
MATALSAALYLYSFGSQPYPRAANHQCLANNIDMCKWGNEVGGLENFGGWSPLYMKCKLYEIPEVNSLSGSEDITNWCKSQESTVANW